MQQIDIGGCLSFGWERFKANAAFHLIAMLVIMVASMFTIGILAGPLMVGYMRALIKAEAGGQPELGDIFGAFDVFLPSFLVVLIFALASGVTGGLASLAMPIEIVALYYIAKGETDFQSALQRAWKACEAQIVMVIVAGLVFSFVGGIGVVACCIGLLVSGPVSVLANFRMAQQLVEGNDQPPASQWG